MKYYNTLLFLAFTVTFCLTGVAQSVSLNEVSEERLRNHVQYLASDSLYGRGTGTPELNIAANYLEEHLKKMNLSSNGEDFYQSFNLTSNTFDKENSFLSLKNSKGRKKKTAKNFIALNQNAGITDIEGELIFVGFGLNDPLFLNSNKQEQDIRGKIVLYSAGTTEIFSQHSSNHWDDLLELDKMDIIFKAGAKAIILVTSIRDTTNNVYRQMEKRTLRKNFSFKSFKNNEQRNIFIITPETADRLTGKKIKWDEALRTVSYTDPYGTVDFKNRRVHIRSVVNEKAAEVKNVIGMVPGSDPILKNECIVFVAHYDHLGARENGVIYNGADDNASGTATLLEVARMFSLQPEKPRRSMLFLFPTAEEIGLFGSEYYSLNPLFPMDKTAACINLDMVGRVYEERDSVRSGSHKQVKDYNGVYTLINDFSPHLKEITTEACETLELEPDFSLPDRFFYSSDHYHFHKNQVPVLNISTGYTADYHKPTDTANRIRTDKMQRIAQLCFLVGMELGNLE